MISLVLPTRKRPSRLKTFMDSAIHNAMFLWNIEFLFYVDDDDPETLEVLNSYKNCNIRVFVGKRMDSLMAIQNFLYRQSKGDIVGYLSDDIRFLTDQWDLHVVRAFPDDMIALVCPFEKHKKYKNATHGFLSRRAIETVGEFVPGYFKSTFSDQWLYEVYQSLGRLVKEKKVHISHDHPGFSERRKNPDLELAKYWDAVYKDKNSSANVDLDKNVFNNKLQERLEWRAKLSKLCVKEMAVMTKAELQAFENRVKAKFVEGKIRAPVHLADGNEDQLIEIFKNVRKTDWVFSAWRSHYHALLHGIDPNWLEDQILNGYSITICNPDHKFYTSAIVGGIVPIALGAALSIKLKQSNDHVWLFVGDMTYRTGACHEAIKYAQGHALPITFVVEDNDIAVQTPTREVWGENNNSPPPQIIQYSFRSSYPHVGAGQWVTF